MNPSNPQVFLVDDDAAVRDSISLLLGTAGHRVAAFTSGEDFLDSRCSDQPGCALLDLRMPGLSGLEVQAALIDGGSQLPVIFLSASGDIPSTVRAMRSGAVDFLTKPVEPRHLLDTVDAAMEMNRLALLTCRARAAEQAVVGQLSPREREVLRRALDGQHNKEIARALGISYRTVEFHRSRILAKTGSRSLYQLARLDLHAGHGSI